MLIEFMTITGWAFWGATAILTLFIGAILTNEGEFERGWATFLACAAIAFIALFTDAFAGARLFWLVVVAAGYLVAGCLWSLKKWYSYVVSEKGRQKLIYERDVNKEAKGNQTWEEYSQRVRPSAAKSKQLILSWIILWPLSVLWWVLAWPRKAAVWAYDKLSTTFDKISERIFAS